MTALLLQQFDRRADTLTKAQCLRVLGPTMREATRARVSAVAHVDGDYGQGRIRDCGKACYHAFVR